GGPQDLPGLYQMCAGMAEYRAGNYQAAINALEQSLKSGLKSDSLATALCYLAMAEYRQRNDDQARASFVQARELLEKQISRPDATLIDFDQTVQDWAICQIAWREANELILGR